MVFVERQTLLQKRQGQRKYKESPATHIRKVWWGIIMCKECGNCTKEHDKTIDDSIDIVENIGL